ncbi:MAG: hypothetical protein RIS07_1025, partial [Actinomycetota bacterium]
MGGTFSLEPQFISSHGALDVSETQTREQHVPSTGVVDRARSFIASTEIDTRFAGMVVALVIIWTGFHFLSGGDFLTSRNLWNLSVQSASIAVMATGMVLIIVSRNIDLSVGSLLGFLGYVMAMVQTRWIPDAFGFEHWYIWIVALIVGIALGAAIGAVQGSIVAYGGVPAFIVTLGGFLVWRGLIFRMGEQGQTLSPLDGTFQLIGGGPKGSLGEWRSWALGILGCAGAIASIYFNRKRRRKYDLAVRPLSIDISLAVIGCAVIILGIALIAVGYESPITGAPTGVAYPVVILIA